MKKVSKIILGIFTFSILFSIFNVNSVLGAGETNINVNGDTIQTQIQANNRIMFTFRQRTRLTWNSNVDIDVNIECDSLQIGVKYVEIEILAERNLTMNMICTEEQIQLGLIKGYTYRIRERERFQYQEGFCAYIQCNDSCQAKLKIQATNQNRNGNWAYYDETAEEWVAVPTTIENGYLVAETDHFSYWTILIPEADNTLLIAISIGVIIGVIAIVTILYFKKRK
ncbi:MAG: hypothetical protein JSV23_05385 [Promethearchaeota archaeon]|nr:MAG: hypothetical protein JSV23_05385 [Candidatus Lokiarchaeota archaeon]